MKRKNDGKKHRNFFKPRARLLQLLGDQLIRDPRIGVFELVKNAYDADAPSAEIIFKNIQDPEAASIEIKDSGEGMDYDTVTGVWLEPGADNRERQRKEGRRTGKFHRLPIGEKGVGRFATHKLGQKIHMATRKPGKEEVVVEIDWNQLTSSRYLDEAPVSVVMREPLVFKGNRHGTHITLTGLRHQWARGDIRKLFRSINAISSPYDIQNGFTVDFKLDPDPGEWLEGLLDAREMEEQAMFFFEFTINDATFDFNYEFRPLDALRARKGIQPRSMKEKNKLLEFFQMKLNDEGKREKRAVRADLKDMGIGPIKGRIFGFDRDRDVLALFVTDPKGLQDYLDENGGIRVYRDGIRVYNYGERETDWLGLDERRIQVPARRISNNLLLGEVHIDLSQSPSLVEKTNREGFVENETYTEFRNAVLSAIIRFEQERSKDKEKIRDAFEAKEHKDENFPAIRGPEEAISALREKVRETKMEKDLGEYVDKVETTYKEMRDTLLGAVGSGLGLTIVFHEMERGVRDLHRAIDKGDRPDRIRAMASHLVELLHGASFLIRTTSRKSHNASEIVAHALMSQAPRFAYHKINSANGFAENPGADFKVKGSHRMLAASVVNLVDNAIYWLNALHGSDAGGRKRIWIGPCHDLEGPAIVVADTGPGLEDEPDEVVRPFFTRKPDGMGIGLYFANMAMKAHGGRLAFLEEGEADIPGAYKGLKIAMVFKGL